MLETDGQVPIEPFFRKTELVVSLPDRPVGDRLRQPAHQGGASAPAASSSPPWWRASSTSSSRSPSSKDLDLVLFLLCVGLEAGPSFFRAFKRHGRRFISNVVILLAVAGIHTVALIALVQGMYLAITSLGAVM